jgi:hypothetical protein
MELLGSELRHYDWEMLVMQRRAAISPVLLVAILILGLFATPGCGSEAAKDTIEDVPKATVDVEWERPLAAPKDLGGISIQQTLDSGYFIVGSTDCRYGTMMHITGCDILLIKTDPSGNVEWQKQSREWWGLDSAFQTLDGGYMFGFNDKLIKTDAAGNEEWQKVLPRVSDTGSIVRQTLDGGYIVLGTTVFWGSDAGADAWLAKTDSSGDMEWEKTLGNGFGETVQQTSDNGFIILCQRTSPSSGWLLKTDWTGEQERDGVLGHGAVIGVIETTDGGFILQSVDDNGTWLTKLGSASHFFTVQWDNNYARQWFPISSIQETSDGGCIVLGIGDSLISVTKVDSRGHVEWEAPLGDFEIVAPTSDGGYVALSYKKDNLTGESDVIRLAKVKCTPP